MFQARTPPRRESQGRGGLLRQIASLELIRTLQTNLLKIPLLGEAETAIGLVTEFWFGDLA